jgi:hypothetical protein
LLHLIYHTFYLTGQEFEIRFVDLNAKEDYLLPTVEFILERSSSKLSISNDVKLLTYLSIAPFSYNEIIGKNIRQSTTRKVTARTGNNSYLLTYVAQDMVRESRSMMHFICTILHMPHIDSRRGGGESSRAIL